MSNEKIKTENRINGGGESGGVILNGTPTTGVKKGLRIEEKLNQESRHLILAMITDELTHRHSYLLRYIL